MWYKYFLQNYQQLSQYRAYNSCIPSSPRSVVLHCLDRRTNSTKQSLKVVDNALGIFDIAGGKHTVNFRLNTDNKTPSCTCKDWIRHYLPCKHFFTVFWHTKQWQWERLPQEYQNSAYLSTDILALQSHFSQSSAQVQSVNHDTEISCETGPTPDDIPTRVRRLVCTVTFIILYRYMKCLQEKQERELESHLNPWRH